MGDIYIIDIANMVIDEATKRFGIMWKVNQDYHNAFKRYVDDIEKLSAEFYAESVAVEVDDINMTISVSIEASDFTTESKNHVLYSLMKHTISTSFYASEDGNAVIELVFPSIWEQ